MSPKYVLTYFHFRARAELARLLFALADEPYEDKRVTSLETWLTLKPRTPFGQLPLLQVGDEQICQSQTIARYLAREFGFAGDTNLEQAKCDMLVDCVMDMLDPIMPCYREKCPQSQEEMRQNYKEQLPNFMAMLENMLQTDENENGYFVGNKLTWADLAVMNAWHWIPGFGVDLPIENYPKLLAHREHIESHPKILKWLQTRPVTPI